MSFFKVTNTDVAATDAKVNDTEFRDHYAGINHDTYWKTIEPFIKQAEELYIKPTLGNEYYTELEAAYQSATPLTGEKLVVLKLLQTASAYYTMYHAYPHLAIRTGEAGTQETSNDSSPPVRMWVLHSARKECCFAAYAYLDKAITQIKTYIEDGSSNFDTFENSTAYTAAKELFLDSAATFQVYFNINSSHKAYTTLIPYIRKAEQLYLYPLLGEDFVTELKTAFKSNTLNANQTKLVNKIKPWLAECTIIESTPEVNLVNDGNGWKIIESMDGIVKSMDAQKATLAALCSKAETNAAHFKHQLEFWLYKNDTLFPTFKDTVYDKSKNYDPNAYDKNLDPLYVSGGKMI